jgi:hypothetical protein
VPDRVEEPDSNVLLIGRCIMLDPLRLGITGWEKLFNHPVAPFSITELMDRFAGCARKF